MPQCNCLCCERARDKLAQELARLKADYALYQQYNHQTAMDHLSEQMRALRRLQAVLNDTPEEPPEEGPWGASEPIGEDE